jgi:large subunit ribosomal protein L9
MEIILLKDMDNLGLAKSVVSVKAGYARNYLIPQGFAIIANRANLNSLKQEIQLQEERAQKILDEANELAAKFAESTLKIPAKSGTSGKIFGSISSVQIAKAIQDTFDMEIDRKKIKLPSEVKMLGTYTAFVTLHKEVHAEMKFEVYDDKEEA